jgi:ammonia channel protein AmtB
MVVSALAAPIYARALIRVVLRRELTFNVTAKGSTGSPDRLWTFRYSLMWAAVPLALIVIALVRHRPFPMMMAWTGVIFLVCLAPVAIWLTDKIRAGRPVPTTTGMVR